MKKLVVIGLLIVLSVIGIISLSSHLEASKAHCEAFYRACMDACETPFDVFDCLFGYAACEGI